jgi:hypothetical protein
LDEGSFRDSASPTPLPSESTTALAPLPTRHRLFGGGGVDGFFVGGIVMESDSVVVLSSMQLPPSISYFVFVV